MGGGSDEELTDNEQELLNHGFALLYDNRDVVDWLVCMLPDRDGTDATCLTHMITYGGFGFGRGDEEGTAHVKKRGRTQEVIYWDDNFRAIYVPYWTSVILEEDRFCIAMHVAAIILHEMVHLCGGALGSDATGVCSVSHMVQNSFFALMLQRYPCLREVHCCSGLVDDGSPWMYDAVLARMDETCAP